jgi:hypothetical protein
MERRYKQSGLDERMSLADFDWRFNPKLPRAACFELHTLKFVAEGQNVRYLEADAKCCAIQTGRRP